MLVRGPGRLRITSLLVDGDDVVSEAEELAVAKCNQALRCRGRAPLNVVGASAWHPVSSVIL